MNLKCDENEVIEFIAVPSAPVNVQGLCTAVVWGAPAQPNGNITSYDVIFYRPGYLFAGVTISERASSTFGIHNVQERDKPPGSGDIYVKVN